MDASLSNHTHQRFALRMPQLTRGRVFAAVACLLGGAIAVNATLFQSERHPAPMFRTLAKPTPAKVDLPMPPLRSDVREGADKAAKGEKLPAAATQADPLLRDLQTELAARGYYKGEPDGKGGPATSKAIRDFQFDRRVNVDGVPSEALLSEVRSSRETMKDELFDLVKRSHSPERGDKPAPRKAEPVKAEPAKPAKSGAAEHRPAPTKVATKSETPHKTEAQMKAEAHKKAEAAKAAEARREAAKKEAAKKAEAARVAEKARSAPKPEAKHAAEPKAAPKAVAKVEHAPKPAPRSRLDADAPLRPPANIAEVIARN